MGISVGIDMVHIPGFQEQLAQPGSKFAAVFSAYELRRANKYTGKRRAEHLAGRWAAKEAFIKAWSQAVYGKPPVIAPEAVNWAEIEVRADAYHRVAFMLHGAIAKGLESSVGDVELQLSITHDGDYAAASVLLIDTPASRI
ncbi:holo-ACP synthase [Corynebacterium canis]|uniref:Holo-[acyl-carrier-protein] synthase n=1 Tax=Corynebacterium canis TaxID=679663 RepID=A0A5C5UH91_9CORY|nr:holo-ACP synthase [Corynebacterium canis]TWT25053.1 holo-ACP synthase [Corynebacterium canis]WJY76063.1 Holo-[acyl-carrier-protein] synthase [Corynebacterium canis]